MLVRHRRLPYAPDVAAESREVERQQLAVDIVGEAMSTLDLPQGLGAAIREHLVDALLAHPDARILLRRAMEDPQVQQSDEVPHAENIVGVDELGKHEEGTG